MTYVESHTVKIGDLTATLFADGTAEIHDSGAIDYDDRGSAFVRLGSSIVDALRDPANWPNRRDSEGNPLTGPRLKKDLPTTGRYSLGRVLGEDG